ncbi:MAG: tetratricopeptide repeat protein [Desulfopila sp.]|jgi:predicted TPR repeat methyltransferase|nr:tetratricopeptide repeat protein [Desulfopila sp.]
MDLQNIFTEALQLHTQGRLEEAKERYRLVLQELPENVNVLGNIGIVCRDLAQWDDALQYCRRAVDAAPDDPMQHINLGAVYQDSGMPDEALKCYEKALILAPSHPKALNNLGKLYHLQGRPLKALAYFEKAVSVEPDYPLALNNIGVLLSERGDISEAVRYLEKSYSLDPYNSETLYNLAGLYNCLHEKEKAVKLLEMLVALSPEHPSAQHMLAALKGKTTERAPVEYVVETFNSYAGRFDSHLQATLQYNVPAALARMLKEVRTEGCFQACLDLGCGTGLSGEACRPLCHALTGVDLSPGMLARAQEKSIYDRIECKDVFTFLQYETAQYDLFLAMDLLIYIGELEGFFAGLQKQAAQEAIAALSIERCDGPEEYTLRESGRYAHTVHYVEKTAQKYGFAMLRREDHGIRKENNSWIPGHLLLFSFNGGACR